MSVNVVRQCVVDDRPCCSPLFEEGKFGQEHAAAGMVATRCFHCHVRFFVAEDDWRAAKERAS